jgi:hypothetical protein
MIAKDTNSTTASATQTPEKVERLFMENNLLRIMGYLFCHDPRAAVTHTEPITDIDKILKKQISIEPNPSYGQPGPADFKVFLAILKKLSDYGRPIPNKVYFSQMELARLTDRSWGGRTGKDFIHSLYTLAHTRITMPFYRPGKDEPFIANFSIPSEFGIQPKGSGIESCEITIPDYVQRSLDDRFFSCLNYNRIRGVPTIQATLYIRLFHHFSNLAESGTQNSVQLRKRYDDICKSWLGGLTVHAHKSKILNAQLGTHLNALVADKFLRSFSIEKTAAKDGFNITFIPGSGFRDDYNRFYKGRFQNELQFKFYEEQESIGHPMELVRRFHEQRTGEKVTASHVTMGEQKYALTLIKEITFEGAQAFVEYGVKRARTTGYHVNTLAGLKTYYGDFLKDREVIAKAKEAASARLQKEQDERNKAAYDQYRRDKAEQLFAAASGDIQESILAAATERSKASGGILGREGSTLIMRMERDKIVAEQFGIPTMDQWLTTREPN